MAHVKDVNRSTGGDYPKPLIAPRAADQITDL